MEMNSNHQWTVEEEKALRDGVAKHGEGNWRIVLNDPQFSSSFINRSTVDLKAKWRNINISASTSSSGAGPYICGTGLWYWMIFEALSSTDNANGLDVDAIHSYIWERGDDNTPEPCKRHLLTMLRRLVNHGQLEMNGNRYQIINYEPNNPDDVGNNEQQTETKEDAAACAAYRIAVAENKEREMMEAIQKANKLDELLEDSISMLALAKDIYDKCTSDRVYLLPRDR